MYYEPNEAFLMHYGVKGMKWGHRKNIYDVNANYYNKRASKLERKASRNRTMASMNRVASRHGNPNSLLSKANRINDKYYTNKANKIQRKADKNRTMARMNEAASKQKNAYKQSDEYKAKQAKRAKALKTGAAVAGTALAAYGGYKAAKWVKEKNVELGAEKARKAYFDNYDKKSMGIFSLKDNTVMTTFGNRGEWSKSTYKNADGVTKAYNYVNTHNRKVLDESRKIRDDIINKSRNENLRTAAGNVYRHYRNKRR